MPSCRACRKLVPLSQGAAQWASTADGQVAALGFVCDECLGKAR